MTFVRLVPVTLSCVLLAAHFSRNGIMVLTLASLAMPWLLLLRRRWVPQLFTVILIAGGMEWIRTAMVIGRARVQAGEPWLRMAVILGAVALVTTASALAFLPERVRARYGFPSAQDTTAEGGG